MKNKIMKAMVLTGHGDVNKIEYKDVAIPKPKKGEVLVEVHATAKNNTDRKARIGVYGVDDKNKDEITSFDMSGDNTFTFPRIQGADIVGTIVEVGSEVSTSRIGKKGLIDFNIYLDLEQNDNLNLTPDYIGHGCNGGFAEYVVVPDENFYNMSNLDISDAELASLGMCSYQTGLRMLNASRVKKDDLVLVSGASGGVGTALIQMCRILGAIPYALSSKEKEAQLLKIGAEKVIDRSDIKTLKQRVLEATNGKSIDAVMDMVGGEYTNIFLDCMITDMKNKNDYPRLSIAGASGDNLTQIMWSKIYLYQIEIHGVSHGTRNEVKQLMKWIREGKLKPMLHATFKLSELHKCEEYFSNRSNNYLGKVVVIPDSKWDEYGKEFALKGSL